MKERKLLQQLRKLGSIAVPNTLISNLQDRLEEEKKKSFPQAEVKSNRQCVDSQDKLQLLVQNQARKTVQGRSSAVANRHPGNMSLTDLVERCADEISKYRRKEASDDQYCLEIFRRAVILQDSEAWAVLQRQFGENVRVWLSHHPNREAALRHDGEQSYIDDAFRRFWQAVSEQQLTFHTLASALSYLHLCLNCAIMDALRAYSRPKEEPIPDYGQFDTDEPAVEDSYQEGELWEVIEALLPDEKEKRVAFLHFHCNLKPREIIRYCPGEFSNEDEIYRLKRNIMERILRNADKIRWRLSSDEK